jgi:hypothetical protein
MPRSERGNECQIFRGEAPIEEYAIGETHYRLEAVRRIVAFAWFLVPVSAQYQNEQRRKCGTKAGD